MHSSAPSRYRFRPRARLERAVSAWARSRQGEDQTPLTLESRRIYILPTRAGLVAALLLFVMFLAGLNYGNSLAMLLCFLLVGFALVWQNLHWFTDVVAGWALAAIIIQATLRLTRAGRTGPGAPPGVADERIASASTT